MTLIHNLIINNLAKKHSLPPKKVAAIIDDYFDIIGGLRAGGDLKNPMDTGIVSMGGISSKHSSGRRRPAKITGLVYDPEELDQYTKTIINRIK